MFNLQAKTRPTIRFSSSNSNRSSWQINFPQSLSFAAPFHMIIPSRFSCFSTNYLTHRKKENKFTRQAVNTHSFKIYHWVILMFFLFLSHSFSLPLFALCFSLYININFYWTDEELQRAPKKTTNENDFGSSRMQSLLEYWKFVCELSDRSKHLQMVNLNCFSIFAGTGKLSWKCIVGKNKFTANCKCIKLLSRSKNKPQFII